MAAELSGRGGEASDEERLPVPSEIMKMFGDSELNGAHL